MISVSMIDAIINIVIKSKRNKAFKETLRGTADIFQF